MGRNGQAILQKNPPTHYLWRPLTEASVEVIRPTLENLADYLLHKAGITEQDKVSIAFPERLGRMVLGPSRMGRSLIFSQLFDYIDTEAAAILVRDRLPLANDRLPGITFAPFRTGKTVRRAGRFRYGVPVLSEVLATEHGRAIQSLRELTGLSDLRAEPEDSLIPLLRVGQRFSRLPRFDREEVMTRLQQGITPYDELEFGPVQVVPFCEQTNPFVNLSVLT